MCEQVWVWSVPLSGSLATSRVWGRLGREGRRHRRSRWAVWADGFAMSTAPDLQAEPLGGQEEAPGAKTAGLVWAGGQAGASPGVGHPSVW